MKKTITIPQEIIETAVAKARELPFRPDYQPSVIATYNTETKGFDVLISNFGELPLGIIEGKKIVLFSINGFNNIEQIEDYYFSDLLEDNPELKDISYEEWIKDSLDAKEPEIYEEIYDQIKETSEMYNIEIKY